MSTYVFHTRIIQSIDRLFSFSTGEELQPAFDLEITFRNVYGKDYNAWHTRPAGEIIIDKLVDSRTKAVLCLLDLTAIAQIEICGRCFDYLRANHLLQYPNVFPFQCLPYRYPSKLIDKFHTAELINFPRARIEEVKIRN